MTSSTPNTDSLNERQSRRFWIAIILGFFTIDLCIAIYAVVVASSDPSFRPMPDYGQRSVDWESHERDRIRSREMGWKVVIAPVEPSRDAIEFQLIGRDGQPIIGGAGQASAYHLTRASWQQTAVLMEVKPGCYRAAIECHKAGFWTVELRLETWSDAPSDINGESPGRFVYDATVDWSNRP